MFIAENTQACLFLFLFSQNLQMSQKVNFCKMSVPYDIVKLRFQEQDHCIQSEVTGVPCQTSYMESVLSFQNHQVIFSLLKTICFYCTLPNVYHLGNAPPLRPLPFPAPLPRGVVLPPLPRVLRRLAWLGALLAKDDKTNAQY